MVHFWIRALGTATLVVMSFSALAEAPAPTAEPDGDKALAIEWANKAQDRFDAGDYQGAIDAVREAQKHARPPTFAVLLAEAHEKLGKLLEAEAIYQSILETKLPATAPPPWRTAQSGVKGPLKALTQRIPSLLIAVAGVEPSMSTVTVDGLPFDAALLGRAVRTNPGKHTIAVSSPGMRPATRELVLKEGENQQVTMTLAPAPTKSAAPTARPAGTARVPRVSSISASPAPSAPGAPASPLWAVGRVVSFGIGGAGLIAGAITGGLVLGERQEIADRCRLDLKQKKCDPRDQAGVESVRMLADISTAAFVVAGVGAAAGTLFWLVPRKAAPGVKVGAGPTTIVVEGSF